MDDSTSSLDQTTFHSESQRDEQQQQQRADTSTHHVLTQVVVQPVSVYQRDEVTSGHREQPATSPQRHRHEAVDDRQTTPRSEAVVVSRMPRENINLRVLESQLPDRTSSSGNVGPGLVKTLYS